MYQRVGTQFGPYQILRVLGAGGMAAVYQAVDGTGKPLALKILASQLVGIDSFRQRFEFEAQVMSLLSHPNIVPVIDYGSVDRELYIAMRYMSGGSLHDRFVVEGAINLQEAALYAEQLSSALDYAHDQGIIHRDLKLANVLLDEERHPMLSDFGIARLVENSLHLTETGSVLGSPHYMSPEQNEGKTLDARSDLYSFAVMIYLMITGQFPFHGETSVAIALQHVSKAPPLPSALNPELPRAVDSVLLKGLAKSPSDRFATAAELAGAFSRAIGEYDTRTVIRVAQLSSFAPRVLPFPSSPVNPIANPLPASEITPVHTGASIAGRAIHQRRRRTFTYPLILIGLLALVLVLARVGLAQFIGYPSNIPEAVTATNRGIVILPTSTLQQFSITATPYVNILPTLTNTGIVPLTPSFSIISKDLYTPVNIRAGPSLTYSVIGQLYASDEGLVLARTTNTDPIWYLIRTSQGKIGWVSGDVTQILPTDGNPLRIPTAASGTIPPEPTPVNPLTPTVQTRG